MLTMTIQNYNDLDKWLSEHYYFEDGFILIVEEDPLEIIVGNTVKGNYHANSEWNILPFKLIPSRILEWTFDRKLINTGNDNCIEGIDPIEIEKGICLEFFTPAQFRLVTDKLVIEQQELIKTTFKPWTSEWALFLTAEFPEIPKPEFWREKLREYGHIISFRYFAGEERQPEQVPYPDYQGYYIQLTDRIDSTQEGIFFKHLETKNGKLRMSLENQDEELKNVWEHLTLILAGFPNAIISSGNCTFSGAKWKQYVSDKVLPTAEWLDGN